MNIIVDTDNSLCLKDDNRYIGYTLNPKFSKVWLQKIKSHVASKQL